MLDAAGQALDPGGPDSLPDLRLASALLSHAACTASAALSARQSESVEDAIASLDDPILIEAAGSRARALELAHAVSPAGAANADELRGAELFVARLIEIATDGRGLRRATLASRLVAVLGVLLILLAFIGPPIASWYARDELPFRASSAIQHFSVTGRTGEPQGPYPNVDLFFHTTEEDHPWIEIDLGRLRRIHRVIVSNRFDCCSDRAVPLVVELRDARGDYHEVARQTEDFNRVTLDFAAQDATAVKLSVPRVTAFHLANVQIR